MEKIISIYCSHKFRPNQPEYLDYKHESYSTCAFTKLNVFDGEKTSVYTLDNLKDIHYLFNKNVTLIAFDAYFHFSLLFHHFHKLNLPFDLSDCKATCCVSDLCRLINHPLPKKTLSNSLATYKELIQEERVLTNPILHETSVFWITHGGERIIDSTSGKWMIFANKAELYRIWNIIIKNRDLLRYDQARVSTIAVNIWGGRNETGVIEIFISKKFPNKIMSIGESINLLCQDVFKELNIKRIYYKTDRQSKKGHRLNGAKNNSTYFVNTL